MAEPPLSRKGQFGLRAGVLWRYMAGIRYAEGAACDTDQINASTDDSFCGMESPLLLHAGLSYGVSRSLELFVGGQYGLDEAALTESTPLLGELGARRRPGPQLFSK